MRFAKNKNGDKIKVSFSGEKAICRDCDSEVFGRKGRIRVPYWTHRNNADCDSWNEPITKWHLDWQNKFPDEYQEVSQIDTHTGDIHRADIKLPNGTVIEVQNSPIKVEEIEQRESFYGKGNLVWILNGGNLTKKSRINYRFEKQEFAISHIIPYYIEDFPEYNMDDFNIKFLDSKILKEIRKHQNIREVDQQNGNHYMFDFSINIDFQDLTDKIEDETYRILCDLYGYKGYLKIIELFETRVHFVPKDNYKQIEFEKKYWRKFIDLMEFPVLIDNINGLDKNLLYWYQKNKILVKNEFIENIMNNRNWLQKEI